MTRFADDLFDDLMREHGQALATAGVPAPAKRHLAARPVLMTAGAGGLAAAAAVGTLVATGGGSPAYAVTTHPNGTVTLAVYQTSGIAGANSKLHQLGDRVVVVPVQPGCPSIASLPAPAVRAAQISVEASGSSDGSVTVDAHGVPAGDILVLGFSQTGGRFTFSMQESMSQGQGQSHGEASVKGTATVNGHSTVGSHGRAAGSGDGSGPGQGTAPPMGIASKLTSGPAPSCVSLPATPTPGGPGGTGVSASGGAVANS
jgi:hypothetical protein